MFLPASTLSPFVTPPLPNGRMENRLSPVRGNYAEPHKAVENFVSLPAQVKFSPAWPIIFVASSGNIVSNAVALIPRSFASAQNELTPPAASKTVFPISSCGSRRKYRRYSSNVRPINTTRSSCSPRFAWIAPGSARALACWRSRLASADFEIW